jgi:hypothetical protein
VGYQCDKFAASRLERFPFAPLTSPTYLLEKLDLHEEFPLGSHVPSKILIKQFKAPSSPITVQHRVCDGCYGGWLVLYKNESTLLNFLDTVDELQEGGCTRGL